MNILVTGGAGFMGSAFVRHMLASDPDCRIVVLDKLTYAGNLDNLRSVADDAHYTFVRGDICDANLVEEVLSQRHIDAIVNFAAETHVDRSLMDASAFIQTDVYGTYVLLEATRKLGLSRYVQIGTDEVYGPLASGSADEDFPLKPSSPYAASKAGADLMVLAYFTSHGVPAIITRACNNFGPHQYPEKFIPLFVTNAVDDEPLPLYGDGLQVREWLFVDDHSRAIELVLRQGTPGQVYNVGSGEECPNIEVAEAIVRLLGKPRGLIRPVPDRPGHDRRYSLNSQRLRALQWQPQRSFEEAMEDTVRWYQDNEWWWRKIKSGEYREYYRRQYQERLRATT